MPGLKLCQDVGKLKENCDPLQLDVVSEINPELLSRSYGLLNLVFVFSPVVQESQ